MTLEATVDGYPQGAKRYTRTWALVAAAFPYHRGWWVKGPGDSPGMAFTAKGAGKADYAMPRQSVWYTFTVTQPTTVRLQSVQGGYPNLFVYAKNASTGRYYLYGSSMNSHISDEVVNVAPGTYWVRVLVENPLLPPVTWTISW